MITESNSQSPDILTAEAQLTITQTFQQAVKHHQKRQVQAAKALYKVVLGLQPDHPDANHNLGILLIQNKEVELGLQYLQAAVTASLDCEQYWISYIDALIQTEQMDVACQALELGYQYGLQGTGAEELAKRLEAHQQVMQQTSVRQAECLAPTVNSKDKQKIRFFRFSHDTNNNLNHNPKHKFAQSQALNIYGSDSIYSFIPKNGCSTLRTSIAYANGCIESEKDFNWIHANNYTFSASLAELVKAKYAFTILRCPFSRLASVYLDKFVGKTLAVNNFTDLLGEAVPFEQISFSFFIKGLQNQRVQVGNFHWRPQIDFLVYKEYDDYFALEEFGKAEKILNEKIGLEILDTRKLTKHGTDSHLLLNDDLYSEASPAEIFHMKTNNIMPSHKSLYSDELIEIVENIYSEDIALYKSLFTDKKLMFK